MNNFQKQSRFLQEAVAEFTNLQDAIQTEITDETERAQFQHNLQTILKEYIAIDLEREITVNILTDLNDRMERIEGDPTTLEDVDYMYEERLHTKLSGQDPTENICQHPYWKDIYGGSTSQNSAVHNNVADVEEVAHYTVKGRLTQMPTDEQTAPSTDDNLHYVRLNDSVSCADTTTFTPPIDPISKLPITVPMRSSACGHIYEKKYIIQYLRRSQKRVRCPYIGCSSRSLHERNLYVDEDLMQKIQHFQNAKNSSSS